MLSRANGVIWMDDEGDNQTNTNTNEQNHDINSISAFNSMQQLDEDNTTNWFLQSSSSPNSAFQNTDPNPVHFFLPPKPNFFNNSLNDTFDLGDVPGFYDFGSQPQIAGSNLAGNGLGSTGYPFSENGSTGNSLVLKPLDNFGSTGTPPTLFQKRVCLRRNVSDVSGDGGDGGGEGDLSFDGSGLNYDSDEFNFEENGFKISGGDSSIANSGVTAGAGGGGSNDKGKKKGPPAKNLMAERRRRKKLNDRLYMLRSVVPKISKMDRASILGDAIEYLKELLQKINNLNHELEATPTSSNATTGSHPLTATPTSLPSRIKQELCPTAIPSPTGQPARVEVRQREGKAMNIHMFCSRRPGLLLSTIRALDDLGIDIQQAVISCFNGFALDVFRAEQCKEGQDVNPDAVRAVLLESAGCQGVA